MRKNFVYATVFSDPARGVVIDMAPGRDASAVLFFASLFSHVERADPKRPRDQEYPRIRN